MRLPVRSGLALEPGFTLIEMLVVLVVIGLSVVLVTPAILPAPEPSIEPVQAIIAAARREAVRRAGAVVVRIDSAGHWLVADPAAGNVEPLSEGTLVRPPAGPVDIRISAIGACMPVSPGSAAVDPVLCRTQPQVRP